MPTAVPLPYDFDQQLCPVVPGGQLLDSLAAERVAFLSGRGRPAMNGRRRSIGVERVVGALVGARGLDPVGDTRAAADGDYPGCPVALLTYGMRSDARRRDTVRLVVPSCAAMSWMDLPDRVRW